MKREIRFSFMWQHEDTGRWLDERWTLDNVLDGDGYPYGTHLRRYCLVETREYTGLKDKNGKEIYEGDILTAGGQRVKVIYNNITASFDLETVNKGLMGMAGVNTVLESIGNIYENPELMEATDE